MLASLCVLLSICGVVTALATMLSIVSEYCAAQECTDETTGGMTTLSFMSREGAFRSRLAVGMTIALLCFLLYDAAVHYALSFRVGGFCETCASGLNITLGIVAVGSCVAGVVSVTADPSGKLHLHTGIIYLGLRICYLVGLSLLAFPRAHRPGATNCGLAEAAFAGARLLCAGVCFVLGLVIAIQAPQGLVTGNLQVIASCFVVSFAVTSYDIVLLHHPASSPPRPDAHRTAVI